MTRMRFYPRGIVRRLALLGWAVFSFQRPSPAQGLPEDPFPSRIRLEERDRILVLAPHPDDEVLGSGGVLQKAVAMKLPLKVVFFTYGDNNQWSFLVYRKHPVFMPKAVQGMGEVRRQEAFAAAKVLGVSKEQMVFLGYPDYRTLDIWYAHWGRQPPAKGMLSQVTSVPYPDAFRPKAPYKGEEIVRDLKSILREFRPTKIFLSHPADHNPDHRSLYLFTRIALWELDGRIKPVLYPYLIHFKHWPDPKGFRPDEALKPPPLLETAVAWKTAPLTPEEVAKKKEAIKSHRSQYISSPQYLLSFDHSNELFGDFPVINLRERDSGWSLSRHGRAYLSELPEQLIDEERIDFVGIEEEFLSLQDHALVFTLRLSRPVGNKVTVSLFVFGYSQERAFQDMPKLRVVLKKSYYQIFDQGNLLRSNDLTVERTPKEITIRIPLGALKDPQRILTSARTYRGLVPLDWVEWRILKVDGGRP
jgi:LmbE family N-acetylglucosaminyl deacetylase